MIRKRMVACLCSVCMVFCLTSCRNENSLPTPKSLHYSNLTEESVQEDVAEVMEQAGVSAERRKVFFDHVNQFNAAVSVGELTRGFESLETLGSKYDPYTMQDEWWDAQPDFLGYNCRITAFGLFGDFVSIPDDAETREDMILMDLVSLEEDNSVLLREDDLERFKVLYSTIPTDATKDISVHVSNLQKDWHARGIQFDTQSKARLISVVFHDVWDDVNHLFIGHIGVLFPVSDNELYFIEKIAFQEPYQLTVFNNRAELIDYLMKKYDVSEGQPTAAPFIMENDTLIDGSHGG